MLTNMSKIYFQFSKRSLHYLKCVYVYVCVGVFPGSRIFYYVHKEKEKVNIYKVAC